MFISHSGRVSTALPENYSLFQFLVHICFSGLKWVRTFAFAGLDQKQLDRMDPNVLIDPWFTHGFIFTIFTMNFKAFWNRGKRRASVKKSGSSRLAILLLRLWLRSGRITFEQLSQPIAGAARFCFGSWRR